MSLVSVIIPVYNAAALINRCLDSVFNQTGDIDTEVIIIDDGSTDNSLELVKKRPEKDRIRIFCQVNSGPAKARNKGIQEAKGKYLAFLDADDYWLPEFLIKTTHFLEEKKDCIAVSVAQKHVIASGTYEMPQNWKNLATSEGKIIKNFFEFWCLNDHICTGSILIKTTIAKLTGGQREDLRICEDLEYWALLSTYGELGFIPELLFVSDGAKVTKAVGWVDKNLSRWNSAPKIEVWQKRLMERNPAILNNPNFINARGKIAKNLSYSILLSKRLDLAKEQIIKYGYSFPDDKISKLLKLAIKNHILWKLITNFLIFREYHRK